MVHMPKAPDPPIIENPADLTSDWLTTVLRAEGLEVAVASFHSESVGTGQMAHNERITLEYEDPAAAARADAPRTLVGKFPSPNEESRAAGARGGYRGETLFYTDLAPSLACVTPKCHYGAVSEDEQTFTLLLEDLAPKQQGDQIAGASDDEIEAAVRNLAGLHAPRWGDRALRELDWIGSGFGDEFNLYIEMGTPAFIERYADRLAKEDVETLSAFAAGVKSWTGARRPIETLVHGDYRLDNLMFETTPEGVLVAAVDWQTLSLGCGGQDLAYLLGNSSPKEQRRAHEARMLEVYREAMGEQGVELSIESIREDYVYGTFQGPTITMLGALSVGQTDRGDEMFMAMASRCCAQIRDCGALDLIS